MRSSLLTLGTVVFLLCGTVSAFAQITNAGFENWVTIGSYMNPVGWSTTNSPVVTTITRSTTAHSGNYAAQGQVVSAYSVALPPVISTVPNVPWTERSATLTGYYQFSAASNSTDSLYIFVGLYKGSTGFAAGAIALGGSAFYKQFSVPIYYATSATPDSAFISIYIVGTSRNSQAATVGSTFLIDDLAFSGNASAVSEETGSLPNAFVLEQNYPNPFNPTTTISFSLPTRSSVSLKVFDMLGREVSTIVSEEMSAGSYARQWNASAFASGIYFYRLQAGSFVQTRKLVLVK